MINLENCCPVAKVELAISLLESTKAKYQNIVGFDVELDGKQYSVFLIEDMPDIAKGVKRHIDEHYVGLKRSGDVFGQNQHRSN